MNPGDSAFATVVVAIATVVVTATLGALLARRTAYSRVLGALAILSDDEVAKARHRLGTLVHASAVELAGAECFDLTSADQDERIADVFTILSAATRLNAVRRSLGPRWPGAQANAAPLPGARGPHRLLVDSASAWVRYWILSIPYGTRSCARLDALARSLGAELDDDDLQALGELERAWLAAPELS